MDILRTYLTSLIVFLGIDAVWLGVVARNFYPKHIGHLMSDKPNLLVALVFYLIYIFGLVFLVLIPNRESGMTKTLLLAALYGLCTYATYDLTNQATLKSWPPLVTVIDLIWGTALTTAVAGITLLILRKV